MKTTLCALTTLLLLASCGGDDESSRSADDHRTAARALIGSFAKALQGELKNALETGGAVEAIAVCSERAPAIANEVAHDGLTVRRIGTRVRNRATNLPSAVEHAILERFAELPQAARADAFEVVESDGKWAFYAPVFVTGPLCLTCHGDRESLAPELLDALAERYPGDEATGYAMHDLRGAFVVETPR